MYTTSNIRNHLNILGRFCVAMTIKIIRSFVVKEPYGHQGHANKRTYVFPTLALHSRILGFPQPQLLELKHHLDNLKVPILHWWIADIQPVLKTRVYGKKHLPETNQQRVYILKIGFFFETSLEIFKAKRQAAPFLGPQVFRRGVPPTRIPLSSISRQFEMQNSPSRQKESTFFGCIAGRYKVR